MLLTLLEIFYLTAMEVPAGECLLEWMFVTGVALAMVHFTFRVVFRLQDRVTKQSSQPATELSARKRAEEMVKRLAYYDELTSLLNRDLFNDRLEVVLAQARCWTSTGSRTSTTRLRTKWATGCYMTWGND
jgi:predicted signal transduction protein with EAL and GGDEF domain